MVLIGLLNIIKSKNDLYPFPKCPLIVILVFTPTVQDSSYINPSNLIKMLNGASHKDQIYFPSYAHAKVKLEYDYFSWVCIIKICKFQ